MTDKLSLGDIVRANETFPHFREWRDAELKVVSLRVDPEGNEWVSVIEGSPRHRGNGLYDSETTDIKADWLTPISAAPVPPANSRQIFDDATATPWLSRMCQPVPPADGALEQLARHFETGKFGKDKYLFPNEIASEIREFAPSPAVAAEPVAWQNMDDNIHGEKSITVDKGVLEIWLKAGVPIRPLYATPPVRGDREAIARALAVTMHGDDVEWRGFLTKADTFIASLPVQPVAPRLPQDTLDRLAMIDVSEEEVYEVLKKHLPEDMIDGIWQEIKEAGRSGAGEREYAQGVNDADQMIGSLWSDLFNKDLVKSEGADYFDKWRTRIRTLSRQAPHSSSETES